MWWRGKVSSKNARVFQIKTLGLFFKMVDAEDCVEERMVLSSVCMWSGTRVGMIRKPIPITWNLIDSEVIGLWLIKISNDTREKNLPQGWLLGNTPCTIFLYSNDQFFKILLSGNIDLVYLDREGWSLKSNKIYVLGIQTWRGPYSHIHEMYSGHVLTLITS